MGISIVGTRNDFQYVAVYISSVHSILPLGPAITSVSFEERLMMGNSFKIVVLDDDPTGIQTVHGCYLVTQWDQEKLETALNDDINFFYVLVNSRGKNREEAQRDITDIVTRLLEINKRYGYKMVFICRSDSTLRGHFPLELNCVTKLIEDEKNVDGFFLIPAFFEAGRVTKNETHYLKQNGKNT